MNRWEIGAAVVGVAFLIGSIAALVLGLSAEAAEIAEREAKANRQFAALCNDMGGTPHTIDLGETHYCIRDGKVILRDDN